MVFSDDSSIGVSIFNLIEGDSRDDLVGIRGKAGGNDENALGLLNEKKIRVSRAGCDTNGFKSVKIEGILINSEVLEGIVDFGGEESDGIFRKTINE